MNHSINRERENISTGLTGVTGFNVSVQGYNLSNLSDVPSTFPPWPIDPSEPHLEAFERFIHWMDLYFIPALILLGVVGNTLSVCVFILSHLRRLSSSVYLAGLAVADAGFLLCALAHWFTHVGFRFYHKNGK